jgi:hypothetical protein
MQIVKAEIRENSYKESHHKGKIYFFPEGESLLQNLQNRRTRPSAEYRKVLSEALQIAGMSKEDSDRVTRLCSWAQKAGCSCGCSPGFIDQIGKLYGKSVFITVK